MPERRQESYAVRLEAAELARSREYPTHQANGDEQRYAGDRYFMSFTKGLPHDPYTGLLFDTRDFVEFRRAIDDGFIDPFTDRVRHGARFKVVGNEVVDTIDSDDSQDQTNLNGFRQWEAPTAGVVYELQGPDAQAVTMPPAPPLMNSPHEVNPELVFEMAEVYELAILRDQPFNDFEAGRTNAQILGSLGRLNDLDYIDNQSGRPRKVNAETNQLDLQTLFRGSSPGVEVGPYLSQFLLIGNVDVNSGGAVAEGKITYGVLQIDQRVPKAEPEKNFMISMEDYVNVQRGIAPPGTAQTYGDAGSPVPPTTRPPLRFMSTPRDLATYVHFDALYEAYLNACLILLGMKTPFDPAFDHLSGVGVAAGNPSTRRHGGGFALYGGPHVLNLVTEVATRALKAVRFQKFNSHIRLRPEALAARVELLRPGSISTEAFDSVPNALKHDVGLFKDKLDGNGTLAALSQVQSGGYFLPMAFSEGSPMHPAYGAGHATVAGACVTMLKAFFDTSAVLVKDQNQVVSFKQLESNDTPIVFRAPASESATRLVESTAEKPLTLEGELNKLAANISIGRNMAGVHFFSDYYDSLRMGEQIAIGILEEQALTYSTDPFVLSIPTFDGDVVRIGRR